MGIGIYIHVPFCAAKCPYCDFYSVRYDKEIVQGYVSAVKRNFEVFREKNGRLNAETIYFGGGTPSLLSPDYTEEILSVAEDCFDISDDAEITMEANPTLSGRDRLRAYRETGINRISFGVQSFNDAELKALGRIHNADGATKAVENAFSAGFENISADLMLGITGQDKSSLKGSIEAAGKLPLSHISAYMLKIEDGTKYDCDEVRNAIPDDDEAAELYLTAVEELERKGFLQYEISNFSKKGQESRHNLRYWKCDDYIGFGPAAHSCFKGVRYAVPDDVRLFIDSRQQIEEVTENHPCDFEEFAMLRLRLTEGLPLDECYERYGTNAEEILKKAEIFRNNGLLRVENNRIILTPKGFLVSNGIIGALVL